MLTSELVQNCLFFNCGGKLVQKSAYVCISSVVRITMTFCQLLVGGLVQLELQFFPICLNTKCHSLNLLRIYRRWTQKQNSFNKVYSQQGIELTDKLDPVGVDRTRR